ncbi:hypothetical protein [Amycolatopsis sp. NPDC051716]|uniref:hypothetical protein n=1 Tax=Actinomycetes TaxID=1760 RepID=UPI0034455271
MSSFISVTYPIASHAPVGVAWDPDHNQYLVRLSGGTTLFLDTGDARVLYASLGASLAARGVAAPPTDLAARLALLAENLRWYGQHDFAEQVDNILAPVTADAAPADAPHECNDECTPGNCAVEHALEFAPILVHPESDGADPTPTEPIAAK